MRIHRVQYLFRFVILRITKRKDAAPCAYAFGVLRILWVDVDGDWYGYGGSGFQVDFSRFPESCPSPVELCFR
jgi:hypothetical protein